jgi:hypothetical protein
MKRPSLILVGGFLGAGKTTLMLKAAEVLHRRGLRTAIITNDQAGELVDTRLSRTAGLPTEEIAGGCFCCRLSDFTEAAERLLEATPDVIMAEPVGSCMDISATILQPLKRSYAGTFQLAPFTVLVDASRAEALLAADADQRLAYLFRNQLAEADLVFFTKSDLYSRFPQLPGGAAGSLCAHTLDGVERWLDLVLSGGTGAGTRLLDIDYGIYAEAEAALGWLNYHATLNLDAPLTPASVVGPLLEDLDARLTASRAEIVHLKVFDDSAAGALRAGICRNGDEPEVDGDLAASPAMKHDLVINLRALASPDLLAAAVDAALAGLPGRVEVEHRSAFRPAPPRPEQHYDHVVEVS